AASRSPPCRDTHTRCRPGGAGRTRARPPALRTPPSPRRLRLDPCREATGRAPGPRTSSGSPARGSRTTRPKSMPFVGRLRLVYPDDIERRYRTLVEQLPLVVYLDALDAASSNIFTSPQVEPLLGYGQDEWVADADLFVRTLHPDDRERVLAAHARTHATHEPLSVEYRLIAKDGRTVWVRDEGVVVFDDDGRPLYLQGYLLDITSEREALEQLRQLALYDPLTGLA